MTNTLNFLALDLGAESGRAILGRFDGRRLVMEEVHRFANGPVRMPSGLHWDVLRLWSEIKTGIGKAALATGGHLAARAGQCTPDELRGGTFTLTNLGMFGVDAFTPIINLPETAILGLGRIKTQPVWAGDHVEPRQMVWLSLTFDHRLVDGGPAARFLQRLVQLVEKPHLLLA